jgi:hypothetical protein
MNEYLEMSVKELKKHQEAWRYKRSKYLAENLSYDKDTLHAYNRIIDEISEAILNRALKDYKEKLYEGRKPT